MAGETNDRSFVNGATTHKDDAALVTAIVTLAHSLRLKVVAEGIETEEELNFLWRLKCDEGQGYFFAKPQPADRLRQTLLRELPANSVIPQPAYQNTNRALR